MYLFFHEHNSCIPIPWFLFAFFLYILINTPWKAYIHHKGPLFSLLLIHYHCLYIHHRKGLFFPSHRNSLIMLRNSHWGLPGSRFISASFSSFFSACCFLLSSLFFWMRSTSFTTLLRRRAAGGMAGGLVRVPVWADGQSSSATQDRGQPVTWFHWSKGPQKEKGSLRLWQHTQ